MLNKVVIPLFSWALFGSVLLIPTFPIGLFLFLAPLFTSEKDQVQQSLLCSGLLGIVAAQYNILSGLYFFVGLLGIRMIMQFFNRQFHSGVVVLAVTSWIMTIEFVNLQLDAVSDQIIFGAFMSSTNWIHWFSHTGVIAASAWIIVANLGAYYVFFYKNSITNFQFRPRSIVLWLLWVIVPILWSIFIERGSSHGPSHTGMQSLNFFESWRGLLVMENPQNMVTSMWSTYGEYMGRTAVWLFILIVLSYVVRLKTHADRSG